MDNIAHNNQNGKPKTPIWDRAGWRRDGEKEINLAMLAIIERQGVASATDGCEYVPICHVYCSRVDAQSCSQRQKYIDIQLGKVPEEYSDETVLLLT